MQEIKTITAIIALFKQNLTREQIAHELKVTVEIVDMEIDRLFENSPIVNNLILSFDFEEKFTLLTSHISELYKSGKEVDHSKFISSRVYNVLNNTTEIKFLWEVLVNDKGPLTSLEYRNYGKQAQNHLKEFLIGHGLPDTPVRFTKNQLVLLKKVTIEK